MVPPREADSVAGAKPEGRARSAVPICACVNIRRVSRSSGSIDTRRLDMQHDLHPRRRCPGRGARGRGREGKRYRSRARTGTVVINAIGGLFSLALQVVRLEPPVLRAPVLGPPPRLLPQPPLLQPRLPRAPLGAIALPVVARATQCELTSGATTAQDPQQHASSAAGASCWTSRADSGMRVSRPARPVRGRARWAARSVTSRLSVSWCVASYASTPPPPPAQQIDRDPPPRPAVAAAGSPGGVSIDHRRTGRANDADKGDHGPQGPRRKLDFRPGPCDLLSATGSTTVDLEGSELLLRALTLCMLAIAPTPTRAPARVFASPRGPREPPAQSAENGGIG